MWVKNNWKVHKGGSREFISRVQGVILQGIRNEKLSGGETGNYTYIDDSVVIIAYGYMEGNYSR